MKYVISWFERPQGSSIQYENAQKRILEVIAWRDVLPSTSDAGRPSSIGRALARQSLPWWCCAPPLKPIKESRVRVGQALHTLRRTKVSLV